MEIREITAAEALVVRHPILRAGLSVDSARFREDDDPRTVHLGAFGDGRLVAVATFFPEEAPGRPGVPAWRLRGMATLADWRGRGGGKALVLRGIDLARRAGAQALWCHARVTARPFYEKLGFAAEGAEFELPHSGKHFVMTRPLEKES